MSPELGKDGKPFDRTRWMEWAASPSRPKLFVLPEHQDVTRVRGSQADDPAECSHECEIERDEDDL